MHRILNDSRLFERAVHRRWLLAADKIQHRLRRNLSDLYYDIQGLKTKLDQKIPTTPLLSELIAELMQLEDEFGQIQIDPKEKSISIVTDPVALEEVSLGSFEIKLFLERISRMHKEIPYRVIATDPNPAGSDSGVTHPHVSGEYLCEGDGHLPIRKALEQGRLCDFYNLVIGKQNIFSPIIGLPLTLIGWPQMLSADFIHREMLGVKPSMTITFLSILVVLVWIVRGIKHAKNK